jgi:hypothetical protein
MDTIRVKEKKGLEHYMAFWCSMFRVFCGFQVEMAVSQRSGYLSSQDMKFHDREKSELINNFVL